MCLNSYMKGNAVHKGESRAGTRTGAHSHGDTGSSTKAAGAHSLRQQGIKDAHRHEVSGVIYQVSKPP